jgi:hypothetical protein
VSVRIESALVNATKSDGSCWDEGCNAADVKAAVDAFKAVTSLLADVVPAASAYVDAANVLTEFAPTLASATSKPDPKGTATMLASNGNASLTLAKNQDTFTPQWPDALFTKVPLDSGTSLTVDLADSDLAYDDPMGSLTLTAEVFRARSGKARTPST